MIQEHFGYVADAVRMARYRAAVATLPRGAHVADLGCGTGVLGLLCLEAGAAHVTFIDHGAIIDAARQAITRAGLADRATFIANRVQHVDLPARVDALICDHVGYLGIDYGIVALLHDARRRFLRPGGLVIPARLTLHAALVASATCRQRLDGWSSPPVPSAFHWLREVSAHTVHDVHLHAADLVSTPGCLGEVDLTVDQPAFLSWTTPLVVARDATIDGIGGWFSATLAPGVAMTNAPAGADVIDRPQAFLPLATPLPVRAGDVVRVTVMARPNDHVLAWTVELAATGQRLTQSTLHGMLVGPDDLAAADPQRTPTPRREAAARMTVLGYCDGRRTAREVEALVLRHHPTLLPSPEATARFVAHVLGLDTE